MGISRLCETSTRVPHSSTGQRTDVQGRPSTGQDRGTNKVFLVSASLTLPRLRGGESGRLTGHRFHQNLWMKREFFLNARRGKEAG